MTIDSSGSVGIGTDSPDGNLHVNSSSAGAVTATTDANELVLESSANVGMTFLTGSSSVARIRFGDADSNARGNIFYNHSDDSLGIQTAGSTAMTIGNDGNTSIGTTGTNRKLTVTGDSTSQGTIYAYTNQVHTGTDTSAHVSIRSDNASASGDVLYVRGDGSGNLLTIDKSGTDQLVVDSSGNVGIGTNTPSATLDVDGTIKLDGNYPVGTGNVALGDTALDDGSLSGDDNVAIGSAALTANTTGSSNVAVGKDALAATSTNSQLTAVGTNTLKYITSGTDAVALGYNSLSNASNTAANGNTALGWTCFPSLTTATDGNIAIGRNAGNSHTTASQSIYIGKSAGFNTNAGQIVAIGRRAAQGVSTGAGNTAIGFQTMYQSVGTGANNTMVGAYAGQNFTGSNNFAIGYQAAFAGSPGGAPAGDNEGYLGDENITTINAQVTITAASDKRDKTDIEPLVMGLNFINKLEPVTYRWDKRSKYIKKYQLALDPSDPDYIDLNNVKTDGTHTEPQLCAGLLAQDVEKIEQEFGFDKKDKTALVTHLSGDGKAYSIDYTRFVPMLIKSVQELSTQVESLKEEVKILKG
jgi:hypothetical protein